MTTDTALALLAEAQANIPPHSQLCNTYLENGGTPCDCHLPELYKRITALLDSGIKDAGDDVVEPEVIVSIRRDAQSDTLLAVINYIDTLLSAYKRVQQEKKTVIDVYEGNLRDADKRLIFWQERAEKAESEREQFRMDAEKTKSDTIAVIRKLLEALTHPNPPTSGQWEAIRVEARKQIAAIDSEKEGKK